MTIGETFKKRRSEKRRSVEEIAARIKVSAKKLHAMENNEWFLLPSTVYIRGYIVKYARYLGLNEKTLLAQYEDEVSHISNKPVLLPRVSNSSFIVTSTGGVLVAIGVFLGGIGIYLIVNWFNFFTPPLLVIENPKGDNVVTSQSEIVIQGRSEVGVKLTANGSPIYPNNEGYFEIKRFLQAGINVVEITATNNLGKSSVETRRILYQQEL